MAAYGALKTGTTMPKRLLTAAVAAGIAALMMELATLWIIQHLILLHPGASLSLSLVRAFLFGGLPEEAYKFAALLIVLRSFAVKRSPDVMATSISVAVSFAFIEALQYTYRYPQPIAWAAIRATTALPMHTASGLIMGGLLATSADRSKGIALGLLVPALLHGLYDLPVILHGAVAGWLEGALLLLASALIVLVASTLGRQALVRNSAAGSLGRTTSPRHLVGAMLLLISLWPLGWQSLVLDALSPTDLPNGLGLAALGIMPALLGIDLLRAPPNPTARPALG
jgi:RsiW-degrading membrane proteinase PrsW (M82 family)